MADDKYLQALIADSRELQDAYLPTVDPWTDADIAAIFTGNAEVERLLSAPTDSPEVQRLAQIAAEESPKT